MEHACYEVKNKLLKTFLDNLRIIFYATQIWRNYIKSLCLFETNLKLKPPSHLHIT
jgi:hypothetical protein